VGANRQWVCGIPRKTRDALVQNKMCESWVVAGADELGVRQCGHDNLSVLLLVLLFEGGDELFILFHPTSLREICKHLEY
jgi:hypothetical protein